jgi:hypothetical protein
VTYVDVDAAAIDDVESRRVEFRGRTAAAVVRAMHRAAWYSPPGQAAYMEEVARRCRELDPKASIDPSSAEAFLASLVAAGFLRRVEE